jgi:hypothetical protein
VDLDTADFGYAVGEVEALVHEEAEVPAALEKILRLSSMLGEGDSAFVVLHFLAVEALRGPFNGGGALDFFLEQELS